MNSFVASRDRESVADVNFPTTGFRLWVQRNELLELNRALLVKEKRLEPFCSFSRSEQ